jgi:hypothetical protein
MGMYGVYARVTPDELDRALKDPQWERELAESLQENRYDGDGEVPPGAGRILDVDKAWNGLWYLLHAEGGAPVDVVAGGDPISDYEWGYGPARYLTASQVATAAAYLRATPWAVLVRHFDPAEMTAKGIYPTVWNRPDEDNLGWLQDYHAELVPFFAAAASAGDAVITWIT